MARFLSNFLVAIICLVSLSVDAQYATTISADLSFVNYSENKIHFYNEDSNLDTFYRKLDSLIKYRKGKVKILQIGGSHIQAEIWPDQVRKRFLEATEGMNGGRGFMFPFKVAKTWNPKNHQISYTGKWEAFRNSIKKHESTWGISGITVSTKDTLSTINIGYRHDSLTNYSFNSVKIFHKVSDASFEVNVISENDFEKKVNSEIGYTEFLLKNKRDTISFEIKKTNPNQHEFILYGISLENNDPGIVYTSVGVNGAKTSSFLRNSLFVSQLETIQPDLVIFCLGINDAYNPKFCDTCYEENYDELVNWVKRVTPEADFLFVTNNDSYYKKKYANKNVFKARDVMINLAKKNHAGLWDLFEVMGGLDAVKNWKKEGYAKEDKIHFTNKGYQLVGDLMFVALMREYKNYLIKNK